MHPVLFRIGSFDVGTYGLLMALGFLAALALAKRFAREDGLAPDAVVDISLVVLIAGILGSKLLLVAVDLLRGLPPSQVFSLSTLRAGGAIHGGILASVLAFFWRVRALKLPVARTLDSLAAAVPLGQAVGRLGCLAAGCCYGASCGRPWAIVFRDPEAARFGTPLDMPLHPAQLYFCLSNLAVLAALLLYRRRRRFPGQLAALYFILEGLFRLALETWRGDYERGFWLGLSWLSTGRVTAVLFVLIGAGVWLLYGRPRGGGGAAVARGGAAPP
jgi:phosphatidylglycerol:prolipoprotein diacylglycerol transferase